jgi:hypothetical protein
MSNRKMGPFTVYGELIKRKGKNKKKDEHVFSIKVAFSATILAGSQALNVITLKRPGKKKK